MFKKEKVENLDCVHSSEITFYLLFENMKIRPTMYRMKSKKIKIYV